ncbi:MAG: DUF2129 domain-containing protein [Acholeplasma sp.]|jgi:uncharacterized protein YlbG (UPF0298 family)|nr:DUF2129 domain-containing protein [Acholeplasma sp.]
MQVNRMSYIVYIKNNEVIKRIEELDVNVVYKSQKQKYATIYFDRSKEKEIKLALEKMKGVSRYEKSLLEAQTIVFEV